VPISFGDREQAFEAKFAHDEEFRFLVLARRDKLFARWVANKLRLSDAATETLVREVLAIANGLDHDRAMLRHIVQVRSGEKADISEGALAVVLEECRRQALKQLTETPPDHSEVI